EAPDLVVEVPADEASPPVVEVPAETPVEDGPPRVLVAHPVASTTRLIRETLESFTDARVETASDPLRAFELALQRPYRLYLFAMRLGDLSGPMLYELVATACAA